MKGNQKSIATQIIDAAYKGSDQGADMAEGKRKRKILVAKRLKEARANAKMTQEQVADKINTNRLTFSGYESGRYEQSIEVLCRIADVYNVSLDYLAGRTNDPTMYHCEEEIKISSTDLQNVLERIEKLEKAQKQTKGNE